jgi:hypothetical protein
MTRKYFGCHICAINQTTLLIYVAAMRSGLQPTTLYGRSAALAGIGSSSCSFRTYNYKYTYEYIVSCFLTHTIYINWQCPNSFLFFFWETPSSFLVVILSKWARILTTLHLDEGPAQWWDDCDPAQLDFSIHGPLPFHVDHTATAQPAG